MSIAEETAAREAGNQLTKRERQKGRRQERLAVEGAANRRERRMRVVRWTALVLVGIGALAVIVVAGVRSVQPADAPDGTVDVTLGEAGHVEEDVDYETVPGAGGPHNPVWQNCGFYDEPVREENAVHSLEHGAVWLTYSPDLPDADIESLASRAGGYVLVSPVEDQPAPVMATAWGKQAELEGPDDPALQSFVRAFEQGPQTPEPGAVCNRGVGTPV